MAKWTVTPGTVNNTMTGGIEYEGGAKGTSNWKIYQDHQPFIDEVKRNREMGTKQTAGNHRKFATIPDIVAIEIMEKYGIDIHHPETIQDQSEMRKFKQIVMRDYPYLVVNKA